jgi:hypothetical protein
MAVEKANFSVVRMARLLGVDRRRYHEWAAGPAPGLRRNRFNDLVGEVGRCHAASDGTYGAPRIQAELRAAGRRVSGVFP